MLLCPELGNQVHSEQIHSEAQTKMFSKNMCYEI